MKKSLIAAAVFAALPALAQAQTNVTMYGIADISVNMVDRGDNSRSALFVDSGGMSTSRWGVRGSEDLGGGLKAVFQFEAGVGVDTGANDGAFWQRTAQVGLQGGFGTIKLGRGYTPAFRTYGTWDAMSYGLFGNLLAATAGAGQASTRFSNAIMYDSPSFGGLQVLAAYSTGEASSEQLKREAGQGFDIALQYKGGPLNVGAYFQQINNTPALSTPPADVLSSDRMGIGAGYQFGSFKLVGGYSQNSTEQVGGGDFDVEVFSIGGIMKLGTGSLHAQYISIDPDGNDNDGQVFGIAYVHPLSKRTNLYAHIGIANNDDAAPAAGAAQLWGSGYSYSADGAPGSDLRGFGVGVRHVF